MKSRDGTEMTTFGTSRREGHNASKFYNRAMFSDQLAPLPARRSDPPSPSSQELIVDRLYCQSSESMAEIPNNSLHLMVTSPPYNVGKDYDEDLSMDDYLLLLERVWRETYRVLAPGGRACINVANLGRKPYIPLNGLISSQMRDIGFLMRGEVIWNKSASSGTSCAWGSWRSASNPVLRDTHEYIMIFAKDSFKRPDSPSKKSTIDRDEFLEWTKSVWTFPAESANRVKHPAPFPLELPHRLIRLLTFRGDVVLDPFIGSGTTAVAAKKQGRYWIGYDTSLDYIKVAEARLQALESLDGSTDQ